MGVSARDTRARRSVGSAGGVRSVAWVALLAAEVLEFAALAVVAAGAYFAGRVLRRVNHRGLLGWSVVALAALLIAAIIAELLEFV